jgi:hypothetical protein
MWFVFHDPAIDLRMVIAGALAPDLIDAPFRGAHVAHSVTFAVAILTVVMLGTIGRRLLRRRLVMLPVGLMLHIVFDGAFSNTSVFWWPIGGDVWPDVSLPMIERGWWNIPLELAGLAMCVWAWRRFGWHDSARRELLVRTGRLDRVYVQR